MGPLSALRLLRSLTLCCAATICHNTMLRRKCCDENAATNVLQWSWPGHSETEAMCVQSSRKEMEHPKDLRQIEISMIGGMVLAGYSKTSAEDMERSVKSMCVPLRVAIV
ncbi:hypothetical protein QBC35DRAFT_487678 [Podospora australis]|uniref:Uncharacterized protein n=1 Tax=Podospora australis TaxID=1536484 RepID=A0AAN6WZJ9_9PEZI|nr:hypothetical protein QBC35DRAFT_487678 [Podospora australis]